MYEKQSHDQTRTSVGRTCSVYRHPEMLGKRLGKVVLLLIFAGFTALLPHPGLMAASSPASCPVNLSVQSISLTDWETGLGAWTVDTYSVFRPETFDTPDWATVGSLPDGRDGAAAFVANLNAGDCGFDDESGVLTLTSPVIAIPVDAEGAQIALNHWFDIEYGWDGGNLKVSINGGAFTLVPGSAFEIGPYTDVLFEAVDEFGIDYNTNPLAEQEAFTGPDEVAGGGAWTLSRVNLAGIAGPGDSIQLRFDFGVDACDGTVGWYVDEVEVYSCGDDVPPSGPRLTLANQVINDHGGTATASAWTLAAVGPTGFSGPGPNVSSDTNFQAGSYDLSATGGPAGYSAGAWVCNGGDQIDADTIVLEGTDTATCTIINNDQAAGLTVVKQVVNDNGGTATAVDFNISSSAGSLVFGAGVTTGDTTTYTATPLTDLSAGVPYSLAEANVSGYTQGSWSCTPNAGGGVYDNGSVTLELGEAATCTIANDDIGPRLRLVKTIINDNGGTITNPNDFGLRINGDLVANGTYYILSSGTHQASEDGQPGYAASLWGDDCAADGSITLALGQVASCSITNDDVDPGFQINTGHSGAWFNPQTAGQGVLVDISAEEQFLFLAWFTYTDSNSDNPFEQRWLTSQGNFSGNSALLPLFETLGGKFDDPQQPTTELVGEVLLEFDDCEQGRISYQFDNEDLLGEFPLIRVIPGSGNVCAEHNGNAVQAVDINAGMDGAWYDIETSGQGFLIDSHPDPEGGNFIFVAWFTYGEDTASGQRWLTAQGSFEGPTTVIDVFETLGGSFDDPQPVSTVKIGEMSLDFTDCSHALLTYTIPDEGLQGEIDVNRLLPGGAALCEELVTSE
jgi:hypothetical protein